MRDRSAREKRARALQFAVTGFGSGTVMTHRVPASQTINELASTLGRKPLGLIGTADWHGRMSWRVSLIRNGRVEFASSGSPTGARRPDDRRWRGNIIFANGGP